MYLLLKHSIACLIAEIFTVVHKILCQLYIRWGSVLEKYRNHEFICSHFTT